MTIRRFFGAGPGLRHHAAMANVERRKARSTHPAEAVRLFLAENAARAGVHAAVVSDLRGFLIGGVGDVDLDALAAVGPLFVSGATPSGALEERIDEVVKNHDLYASRLAVGGETLVLTSLGARFPEQRRAEHALSRILA
jgi:hypothetical protein